MTTSNTPAARKRLDWTVGKKMTALAAAGLLTTITVSVGGIYGLDKVEAIEADKMAFENAENIVLRLDTRSSELKVSALKAALADDPAVHLDEIAEDATTIDGLLNDLAAVDLPPEHQDDVPDLRPAFDDYQSQIAEFIESTVADQDRAAARYEEVQAANDEMDAVLSPAVEDLEALVHEHKSSLLAAMASSTKFAYIITLVALVALVVIARTITRSITVPLRASVAALERVADGDLTVVVPEGSAGELGVLEAAINTSVRGVSSVVTAVVESAEQVAAASHEVSVTANEIATGAAQVSAQAETAAAAAEQVSRNVQTLAAGSEQMEASIREIAHTAATAATIASEGVAVVEANDARIAKLGESSGQIGAVVVTIDNIAGQTNLLALNATIEAARAGEAGKGFAVVAGEVKELAAQTSQATTDIGHRIEAIQSDTAEAVDGNARTTQIINAIHDGQTTIASAVEEQSATANEMSRNVSDAATGSAEIAENVKVVAEIAGATTHAVSETQSALDEIARMAADLRERVSQFKVSPTDG
jgi:methyl-accepting chemotaxis protein